MNHKKNNILLLILFWILNISIGAQTDKAESDLLKRIKALPGITAVKNVIFDKKFFTEVLEVMIEQPVDHSNPHGEKFQQKFYLSHADFSLPVMLETEGYATSTYAPRELTKIIGGNQVYVEHRYFGRSVPQNIDWKYLTVKQSADDLHTIVSTLKQLYKGKWVASGTSKGGQAACFYKVLYPGDVDVCVPYVAPINLAQEDPRIYAHLNSVGDSVSRKKISDYQIAMLKREEEMLPLIREGAAKRRYTFSRCTFEEAYELGLMEYEFTYWQYGRVKSIEIPNPDAPAEKMVEHYFKVDGIGYFTDSSIKSLEPSSYQMFTELGSYNYDVTNMKPYLKYAKNLTLLFMCPKGVEIVYNPETMQKVYHYLQYEANNMIFIYGEYDTWSSTAIELIGKTNSIKLVGKGAFHGVRVKKLSDEQKELFYSTLEKWLNIKVNRI